MGFESLPFGVAGLIVLGLYILALFAVGWLGKRRSRKQSLGEFYLAGRNLGLVVLFLTLYATQYSGNTLLGFSGKGYEIGFGWLVSVQFMTVIVVAYLWLAPALNKLSRNRNLVTPSDYVLFRYENRALAIAVALIMVFVSGNFAVAQLKAMGKFFVALSGGRIDLWVGVVTLACVMVIYESLGGMRAVAWTDALQGLILLATFAALILILRVEFGPLSDVVTTLARQKPQCIQRPDAEYLRTWASFLVLFGLGASCYPMAIQRLYAARSQRSLRRSIALMAFMPLTTTLVALVVGLYAAAYLTQPVADRDQVLPALCRLLVERTPAGYVLSLTLLAAFLAALMSTADSALLSLASIATRDIYAPLSGRGDDQRHLTKFGKWVSWAVMAVLVILALVPMKGLIRLLEVKLEVLVQVAPAFFLGLHSRVSGSSVLLGLLLGVGVFVILNLTGHAKCSGLHAGTVGLGVNLVAIILCECLRRRSSVQSSKNDRRTNR